MKAFTALSCVLLLASFGLAQTPAKPGPTSTETKPPAEPEVKPSDVVLTIGSENFTKEQFEALLKAVPPQFAQAARQMGKKQFAAQYGMMLGLARTAEREHMDKGINFEFQRMQLLAQIAFQQISQRNQVISDEQVKAYYTAHQGEFQQATVRGIYVALNPPKGKDGKDPKARTEDEAKALALQLRDKIVKGADFAEVAKESSEEAETAAKGGDLGTVRRGQLPPNIEKAVFALKAKEVSQPVAEATGFYLFKMEDLRATTQEEATPQIRQKLQEAATVGTLDKVKAEFPVKYNDNYFVEAPPNPLATPPVKP